MAAVICEFLAVFVGMGAPVPKVAEMAPPPRPLIQFPALRFLGDEKNRFDRPTSYGLFDTDGPNLDTFKQVPSNVRHLAMDPKSKTLYGINSNEMFVVQLGTTDRKRLNAIPLDPALEKQGWLCGITFDTKRNRVVVVSLSGRGSLWTFDVKTDKWNEITDMDNLDLVALTYSQKNDLLYGLYQSFRNRKPTVGVFDPVTGMLRDEIELDDANIPKELGQARGGQTTAQMAALGNHLMILTDTHMYRVDLKTNKITVEWKK